MCLPLVRSVRTTSPVSIVVALLLAACEGDTPTRTASVPEQDTITFRFELDSARKLLISGDLDAGESIVRVVMARSEEATQAKQRAMALGYLGMVMQRRGDLDSAVVCQRAVVELAQRHGLHSSESTGRLNLGVALEMKGDHAGALEQQLEALRIKEELHDSAGLARSYNNIGMLQLSTNDTAEAEASFHRAIAINAHAPDSTSWHRSLMNLAVIDIDRERFDSALMKLRRSLEVRPQRLYGRSEAAIWSNMALAHEGLGQVDSARTLYEAALTIARQNDDERALGEVRHYLADLLVRTGDHAMAIAHLDTGLVIARSLQDKETERQTLLSIAEAQSAMGRFEQAYATRLQHDALADSLMNAGKDAVMRELHVKYEVEHKERENDQLRAAGELAAAKAQRNLVFLIAAILIAAAVALLAWLLVQRTRERARKREADLEQQALRAQMDPHFLFNALNTIPGLYASTDARTATAYVGHLSNLLRLILDTSRQVEVPLRQELDLIGHYLHVSASRHPGLFAHAITVDPAIDADAVMIPPMLLQPLVENAILHGLVPKRGGGELIVEVVQETNALVCRIRDNGIGRTASAKASGRDLSASKGLSITAARIDQFNAGSKLEGLRIIDHESPTGTEVIVRTKLQRPW